MVDFSQIRQIAARIIEWVEITPSEKTLFELNLSQYETYPKHSPIPRNTKMTNFVTQLTRTVEKCFARWDSASQGGTVLRRVGQCFARCDSASHGGTVFRTPWDSAHRM